MAVFYFLIGLELKRELIDGELSEKDIILPGIGAIGGMAAYNHNWKVNKVLT